MREVIKYIPIFTPRWDSCAESIECITRQNNGFSFTVKKGQGGVVVGIVPCSCFLPRDRPNVHLDFEYAYHFSQSSFSLVKKGVKFKTGGIIPKDGRFFIEVAGDNIVFRVTSDDSEIFGHREKFQWFKEFKDGYKLVSAQYARGDSVINAEANVDIFDGGDAEIKASIDGLSVFFDFNYAKILAHIDPLSFSGIAGEEGAYIRDAKIGRLSVKATGTSAHATILASISPFSAFLSSEDIAFIDARIARLFVTASGINGDRAGGIIRTNIPRPLVFVDADARNLIDAGVSLVATKALAIDGGNAGGIVRAKFPCISGMVDGDSRTSFASSLSVLRASCSVIDGANAGGILRAKIGGMSVFGGDFCASVKSGLSRMSSFLTTEDVNMGATVNYLFTEMPQLFVQALIDEPQKILSKVGRLRARLVAGSLGGASSVLLSSIPSPYTRFRLWTMAFSSELPRIVMRLSGVENAFIAARLFDEILGSMGDIAEETGGSILAVITVNDKASVFFAGGSISADSLFVPAVSLSGTTAVSGGIGAVVPVVNGSLCCGGALFIDAFFNISGDLLAIAESIGTIFSEREVAFSGEMLSSFTVVGLLSHQFSISDTSLMSSVSSFGAFDIVDAFYISGSLTAEDFVLGDIVCDNLIGIFGGISSTNVFGDVDLAGFLLGGKLSGRSVCSSCWCAKTMGV